MARFFAVCNVGGPISIAIQADSVSAAVAEFDDIDQRSVIDDGRCDVSRLLGWKESDTRGKTEDEIAVMLQAAGCKEVRDLDSVYNYHGRTSGHLQNGWALWEAPIRTEGVESVKSGYVVGSDGRIYVQIPDDSQFGFAICDDEQSWAGGVGSGLASWTLIPNDDSRIIDEVRERLGWILDEQSSDMPPAAKPKRDSNVFILVFRPHQRPAWAQSFKSNEEFIKAWRNGDFDQSCSTNRDLSKEDQEPTYNNAYSDVGHDLALLTRLHSADEARKYLMHSNLLGRHNKGIGSVLKVAVELGWVPEDWMESFETISKHVDLS
jgi:hypothetical protein